MQRVIRLYSGFQFFFSLLLWLPIFFEYQRRAGLSPAEIFGIQSIYYLVFCFLEIPTGYLADRLGDRACMRAGAATLVLANLLPMVWTSYDGFLAHFLLIALARSLVSGASSAYLYEYLAKHGRADLYKRVEGKARAYGLLGKVVGWSGIGLAMQWYWASPYWLSALSAGVAAGLSLGLPQVLRTAGAGIPAPPAPSMTEVLSVVYRAPSLILIMFQGVALFVLARICQVNLFQPILESKSFDLKTHGLMMSVMTVFEAIGSWKPDWMRRWLNDLDAVYALTLTMALSLSGVALSGTVGTILFLGLFSWVAGISFPIQRQLFNDAIPNPRFRATLLSTESLVDRAACAWVASLISQYFAEGEVNGFLHLSALATVLGVGGVFVLERFSRKPNQTL